MKKIFIGIISFTLILGSCRREEVKQPSNQVKTSEQTTPSTGGHNALVLNPYEDAGEGHNALLACLMSMNSLSFQDLLTCYTNHTGEVLPSSVATYMEDNFDESITENPHSYLTNLEGVSEAVQGIMTALSNIFNCPDDGSNKEERIAQLEQEVLNSDEYSEAEKERLLGSLSVAKHSLQYWTDTEGDQDICASGIGRVIRADIGGFFMGYGAAVALNAVLGTNISGRKLGYVYASMQSAAAREAIRREKSTK